MRKRIVFALALILVGSLAPATMSMNAASLFRNVARAASSDYTPGRLTQLTDNGGRVVWSNTGTIFFDREGPDGYYDLWKMAEDGSNQTCVTCDDPRIPKRHVGQPTVSPNGRYVVFQASKVPAPVSTQLCCADPTEPGSGRFNDLWAIDLWTDTPYRLTNVPVDRISGSLHPQFSNDGTRLFWSDIEDKAPADNPDRLYDDMRLAVADFVTIPAPHLENPVYYNPGVNPGWMEAHGWSLDDRSLYFTCVPALRMNDNGMEICRIDLDDRPNRVTRLTYTSGMNGERREWDEHAHLSPRGDAISWISSQPHGVSTDISAISSSLKTDMWLMNLDGTNKRRLTYFNDPSKPGYTGTRVIVADHAWNRAGTKIVMLLQIPEVTRRFRIVTLELGRSTQPATSDLP